MQKLNIVDLFIPEKGTLPIKESKEIARISKYIYIYIYKRGTEKESY